MPSILTDLSAARSSSVKLLAAQKDTLLVVPAALLVHAATMTPVWPADLTRFAPRSTTQLDAVLRDTLAEAFAAAKTALAAIAAQDPLSTAFFAAMPLLLSVKPPLVSHTAPVSPQALRTP